MTWESEIKSLILFGKLNNETSDPIDVLKITAEKDPELLLSLIIDAFDNSASGMVIPGIAAILCGTDINLFNPKVDEQLFELLASYSATELLLLTELIKSKVFGRGLGSKNQKIVRRILESWTEIDLKDNITLDNKSVYALIRLVHPRFKGSKGKIVKTLLN